jgi:hypothetical protein
VCGLAYIAGRAEGRREFLCDDVPAAIACQLPGVQRAGNEGEEQQRAVDREDHAIDDARNRPGDRGVRGKDGAQRQRERHLQADAGALDSAKRAV